MNNKYTYLLLFSVASIFIVGIFVLSNDKSPSLPVTKTLQIENKEIVTAPSKLVSLISEKTFGYSTTGRPITGYEVGSGTNTILFFAGIHGDEKNTTELLTLFLEEIKANPSMVSETKKLVIIPLLNPDGYYDRTDNLNANEVNLNRNFGTTLWKPGGLGSMFAGNESFSESETRVLRDVIEQYQPDSMVAFHSQGGLIAPEEDPKSIAFGNWYIEKSGYKYYDEWQYHGTATEWFVETMKGPAITVELTNHEHNDWELNKSALFELASSTVFK